MKGLYYKRSLSLLDNGEYFPVQQPLNHHYVFFSFFLPTFICRYIDLIQHYFKQNKTNEQ